MMNNATVVNIQKLPDCLFRIWIKPDWDLEHTWFAGQFLRLGIIETGFDSKSLRPMTIVDIQDNIFEFFYGFRNRWNHLSENVSFENR